MESVQSQFSQRNVSVMNMRLRMFLDSSSGTGCDEANGFRHMMEEKRNM